MNTNTNPTIRQRTTAAELRDLTAIAVELSTVKADLQAAILKAHASGRYSLREIAEATGLSHMTVARLAVKGE